MFSILGADLFFERILAPHRAGGGAEEEQGADLLTVNDEMLGGTNRRHAGRAQY